MIFPLRTFAQVGIRDVLSRHNGVSKKTKHLTAAVEWLCKAHDQGERQGVSYGYSLRGGWKPPYRETTGYIAETFFDLSDWHNNADYRTRAVQMCDWEIKFQNKDGSFSNPHFFPEEGIVFDTGQVLFGLVRAYEETKDQKYLDSAIRAGAWLKNIAVDEKLLWTKHTHNKIPHVYNTRVSWAILRLNSICLDEKLQNVARVNLDFALENLQNGWFQQCAFNSDAAPFTHTIAYAIRGLLESSRFDSSDCYRKAALTVADSCLDMVAGNGFIPGQINADGKAVGRYVCLTGNCQLAIIWSQLYSETGELKYKTGAVSALRYVMECQNLTAGNKNIHGAIKGSHPVWGRYSPFTYPNWATKFFIDAMMLCWEWL